MRAGGFWALFWPRQINSLGMDLPLISRPVTEGTPEEVGMWGRYNSGIFMLGLFLFLGSFVIFAFMLSHISKLHVATLRHGRRNSSAIFRVLCAMGRIPQRLVWPA